MDKGVQGGTGGTRDKGVQGGTWGTRSTRPIHGSHAGAHRRAPGFDARHAMPKCAHVPVIPGAWWEHPAIHEVWFRSHWCSPCGTCQPHM